jgi:DNA repair protein SbcD/Mre11
MIKFIHTADIHLDSPLRGLASYQNAPAESLRTATRDAFRNLVSEAIEAEVDFCVIAGDLYDGNWKDYNTGQFFVREMGRLNEAAIPVYLLYGNHDAESEITKRLTFPPNVHVFDARKPVTYMIDTLRVALHGRSFKDAATTENLAVDYPDPVAGWLNIGVLHTALEGYAAHPRYAPCSLPELTAKGYDYWALGHVHEFAVLQHNPWVVFPGNLQGRHIRETGPRGAVIVEANETGIVSVDRLFVDVMHWECLDIDVGTATSLPDVVLLANHAFEALLSSKADTKPMSVRVTVTGRTAAHGELFGMGAQLREEILALATTLGGERLWIEKVKVETTPAVDASQIKKRADAIADLQILLDQVPFDESFMRSLAQDLQQLTGKAPLELTEAISDFKAIRSGDVSSIVQSVIPALIAQLAQVH